MVMATAHGAHEHICLQNIEVRTIHQEQALIVYQARFKWFVEGLLNGG